MQGKRSELKGKVQTVRGVIDGDQLGFTLPHEHFLISCAIDFREPDDPKDKEIAYQPVSFENLSWVRSHIWFSLDNVQISDVDEAISEAVIFREAGGRSIVDVTPNHVGRDPAALARISREAGIHVVMGTAYYREPSYKPEMNVDAKTEEEIAAVFIRDVLEGIDGVCAGIIGELACSWPMTENEAKVLRAGAIAQQETGAALMVHPGFYDEEPLKIVKILKEGGADISRVIMCHMGETIKSHSARFRLADTGCCLEWDRFGSDGEYPFYNEGSPNRIPDVPNDPERLNHIIQLIGEGFLDQILISHDTFAKIELHRFGGQGYSHILTNVLPLMREKGFSEERINAITVENPKRLLTFV
jgi:phosphotriesterase-related protein